jgi:hypothetical protein
VYDAIADRQRARQILGSNERLCLRHGISSRNIVKT